MNSTLQLSALAIGGPQALGAVIDGVIRSTSPGLDLWRAAYHEAGHAVVAINLWGWRSIRLLSISRTEANVALIDDPPDALIADRIAVSCGGPAADALHQSTLGAAAPLRNTGEGLDLNIISKMVGRPVSIDQWDEQYKRGQRIVQQDWEQTGILARNLVARWQLTGEETRQALGLSHRRQEWR